MKSSKVFWSLMGIVVIGIYINSENRGFHAGNCISAEISSYDENVTDYHNSCNHGINVQICKNQAATDFLSAFNGKDRTSCQNMYIEPGGYIDQFYGANDNSSFLRKAVSTTQLRLGACRPPVWPEFGPNDKVLCPDPSS